MFLFSIRFHWGDSGVRGKLAFLTKDVRMRTFFLISNFWAEAERSYVFFGTI